MVSSWLTFGGLGDISEVMQTLGCVSGFLNCLKFVQSAPLLVVRRGYVNFYDLITHAPILYIDKWAS